jgi:hypothetical protein
MITQAFPINPHPQQHPFLLQFENFIKPQKISVVAVLRIDQRHDRRINGARCDRSPRGALKK